jgi:hypothetical protein
MADFCVAIIKKVKQTFPTFKRVKIPFIRKGFKRHSKSNGLRSFSEPVTIDKGHISSTCPTMTMAISSNERRALERTRCREALAAHISKSPGNFGSGETDIPLDLRLGLIVAPNQVRLHPRPEDGYAWSVTEPSKHLLQSSLSDGNIRIYRSIREELGRSLEAVAPKTLQSSPLNQEDSVDKVGVIHPAALMVLMSFG